ncbi:hypothetical protein ATN84_01685 [Paramesorhizobium deserti]|uniref:Uncharacterized protein n=1 Tax=Paramesorhizobium deserti TaxID=1494590 RepID=A0A135HZC1_9HYPH|nr:hypothetical protein ATN84_01685 [Paramesorhizobium deserti]
MLNRSFQIGDVGSSSAEDRLTAALGDISAVADLLEILDEKARGNCRKANMLLRTLRALAAEAEDSLSALWAELAAEKGERLAAA